MAVGPALAFSNLPYLRAAVSKVQAGTGRARIACVGDSVTAGWGAAGAGGGTGSSPGAAGVYLRTASLPYELSKLFKAAGMRSRCDAFFGTGLSANNTAAEAMSANPDISFGADWTVFNQYSLGGYFFGESGSGSTVFTFTPEIAADTFEFGVATFPGNAVLLVSDPDGTIGTINTSAAAGFGKTTLKRSTPSTKPITFARQSGSAVAYVEYVIPFDSTSPALEIWNVGRAGSKASDWNSTSQPWAEGNSLGVLTPDAWTLELGANDANAGVSAATYQSNMQTLISKMKSAAAAADVQLIACHKAVAPAASYDIGAYLTTISGLATSNSLPTPIDFYNGVNIIDSDRFDGIHLVNSGYAKEALFEFQAITR